MVTKEDYFYTFLPVDFKNFYKYLIDKKVIEKKVDDDNYKTLFGGKIQNSDRIYLGMNPSVEKLETYDDLMQDKIKINGGS